ncbi:MAG: class I SAM-dependent methyltransferase family protein [Candidatus Thermoplasmatota archaeon]|nr:class I SAM-dependent methyltransferase family protein [Candidatus Thermoplasmatota archaeon]
MNKEKAKAVCIPKQDGERIRRLLLEEHLLRTDLKIKKTKTHLLLPVISESPLITHLPITLETFEVTEKPVPSYKMLLDLPEEQHLLLPSSFDIIGDIILIKIPKELEKEKRTIGEALLQAHKQVRTICAVDPVSGEFRTHETEIIAGINRTQTIHTEYGIQLAVDVKETYFSPRLASERYRIASLVQDHEHIVDLFTGVAPFPIMIACYAHPQTIIAFDKNPTAVQLARTNIKKNKVEDIIEIYEHDSINAKEILDDLQIKADRILMNLPMDSFRFLPLSFSIMNTQAIIHLYEIIKEEDIPNRLHAIEISAEKNGVCIKNMEVHRIKTYAPHEFYIGIDITAQKNDADVA